LDAEVATTIFKVNVQRESPVVDAPVETALTRAAEKASTNAPVDGIQAAAGAGGSRAERRSRPAAVGAASATKKRKKRR
jgi:hypothetical protein